MFYPHNLPICHSRSHRMLKGVRAMFGRRFIYRSFDEFHSSISVKSETMDKTFFPDVIAVFPTFLIQSVPRYFIALSNMAAVIIDQAFFSDFFVKHGLLSRPQARPHAQTFWDTIAGEDSPW
jgi:hypothetical protein